MTTLAKLTLAGRTVTLVTDGQIFSVRDSHGRFVSGSSRAEIAWAHFGRRCQQLASEAGVVKSTAPQGWDHV